MLVLTNKMITSVSGKLPKKSKEKKQTKTTRPFCKTYRTPLDVIEYYNDPNYCLNCNKVVPAGVLIDYIQLKSEMFCSEKCKSTFFRVKGLELFRRKAIYSFYSVLTDCVNSDIILSEYRIKNELKERLLNYTNAINNRNLKF